MPFLFLLTLGSCSEEGHSLQLSMLAKETQLSRFISDVDASENHKVPWFGDMLGGGQCFCLNTVMQRERSLLPSGFPGWLSIVTASM